MADIPVAGVGQSHSLARASDLARARALHPHGSYSLGAATVQVVRAIAAIGVAASVGAASLSLPVDVPVEGTAASVSIGVTSDLARARHLHPHGSYSIGSARPQAVRAIAGTAVGRSHAQVALERAKDVRGSARGFSVGSVEVLVGTFHQAPSTGISWSQGHASVSVLRGIQTVGGNPSVGHATVRALRAVQATGRSDSIGVTSLGVVSGGATVSIVAEGVAFSAGRVIVGYVAPLIGTGRSASSGATTDLARARFLHPHGSFSVGSVVVTGHVPTIVAIQATGVSFSVGSSPLQETPVFSPRGVSFSIGSVDLTIPFYMAPHGSFSVGSVVVTTAAIPPAVAGTGRSGSAGQVALQVVRAVQATGVNRSVANTQVFTGLVDTIQGTGASLSSGSSALVVQRAIAGTSRSHGTSSVTIQVVRQFAASGVSFGFGRTSTASLTKSLMATGRSASTGSAALVAGSPGGTVPVVAVGRGWSWATVQVFVGPIGLVDDRTVTILVVDDATVTLFVVDERALT